MDIFKMIDSIIKDGNIRWKQIESLRNNLKEDLDNGKEFNQKDIVQLLVLLVDHLKPMIPNDDDLKNARDSIKKILGD